MEKMERKFHKSKLLSRKSSCTFILLNNEKQDKEDKIKTQRINYTKCRFRLAQLRE